MKVRLKYEFSEWSKTNKYYDIDGDITLGDIINKANEYNCECNIIIRNAVGWSKIFKLNRHITYKGINDDFIDKYKNNKVESVELSVVINYDEIIKVTFIIDYLYFYQ